MTTGFPGGKKQQQQQQLTCQCSRYKIPWFDPWVEKILGGGHGNPLQYFCLENPMDRGAWSATVHRVTKSWSQLKWLDTHTHMYSWLLSWWVSQNPTLGSLDVEASSRAPCYLKVNSGVVHSACDDFVPLPSQPAHISSPSFTSSPQPGPWGEHMWAISTSWAHQLATRPSAFPEFPPALYSATLLSQPRPWSGHSTYLCGPNSGIFLPTQSLPVPHPSLPGHAFLGHLTVT